MLRGVGRAVVWCVLALVLVRGATDVLSSGRTAPVARVSRSSAVAAWPDDEARAFAADFARAYLSYSPRHPGRYARGLLAFVSPELASSVVPQFASGGSRQVVGDAVVARSMPAGEGRALVTVAATLVGGSASTRYLTVPVARDARGGLVVYDLPSFSPPPARGQVALADPQPLSGADAPAVQDVLTRFFAAFLAGRSADLGYLVLAGTRIGALGQAYELGGIDAVEQVGAGGGRRRVVLVTVRARDSVSRAVYALRYRVELVRRDRWYVAAVNSTGEVKSCAGGFCGCRFRRHGCC